MSTDPPRDGLRPQTVHDCWLIARAETEKYQTLMERSLDAQNPLRAVDYQVARDACDKIALLIRRGERRQSRKVRGA